MKDFPHGKTQMEPGTYWLNPHETLIGTDETIPETIFKVIEKTDEGSYRVDWYESTGEKGEGQYYNDNRNRIPLPKFVFDSILKRY